VALLAALVVGACAASPSSPAPSGASPLVTPTAVPSDRATPEASPTDVPAGPYRLRATLTAATSPVTRFPWSAPLVVTGDLVAVRPGPSIEVFPSSLLPNLQARPITEAGFQMIVEEARRQGLLTGGRDFTPPGMAPGAAVGRIELVAGGTTFDFVGDPSRLIRCDPGTRCIPDPGTAEAFAAFWQRLPDLSWLDRELGPESQYEAPAFALLVTASPDEVSPRSPAVLDWPLDVPLATFGRPIGPDALPRCGTSDGPEAATLRRHLAAANELTRWLDQRDPSRAERGLVARPMVPGEDACAEVFGLPPR